MGGAVNNAAHRGDHGDVRFIAGGPRVETHESIWHTSVCVDKAGNPPSKQQHHLRLLDGPVVLAP